MERAGDCKQPETVLEDYPSLCIIWTIWTDKNSACFENKKYHISRVKNLCLHSLFFGVRGICYTIWINIWISWIHLGIVLHESIVWEMFVSVPLLIKLLSCKRKKELTS